MSFTCVESKDAVMELVDTSIQKKLSRALWFANDTQIITSGDDGFLRRCVFFFIWVL